MIKSVNKKEFDELFTKDENKIINIIGKNCIIKFSAEWCQPCKFMTPILEKISNEQDISIFKVDTDEEFELAQLFNIRSIPTIYFIPVNGEPKHHVGAMSQSQIEKLIQKYFGE